MMFETIEQIKDEIIRNTALMRDAQKAYFRYRTVNYLEKSKTLESEVDSLLAQLDTRYKTHEAEKQGSLF